MCEPCDELSILLVEDDPAIRLPLAELLTLEGYRVDQARNGLEALEQLERHKASIVLLDLMMPLMNGWQFREAMMADPRLSDVPVIVLSAVARHPASGKQIDALALIPKPPSIPLLLDIIERTIGAPQPRCGPESAGSALGDAHP